MRNKIEQFIIKQTDYKHPNLLFGSIVILTVTILTILILI